MAKRSLQISKCEKCGLGSLYRSRFGIGALRVAVLGLTSSVFFLGGCVTENPRQREVAAPPPSARPNRLVLSAGQFMEDSDANGYVDAMTVSVYLFDERYQQAPISCDGVIEFVLRSPTGKEIRTWTFTEAQTKSARTRLPAGPGYTFRLSLRDNGTDQMPSMMAELSATFKATSGESARSNVPIRVGKTS